MPKTVLTALCLGFALASANSEEPHRASPVVLRGRVLETEGASFLGLGASYMQALRHTKFDPVRLDRELAFLAECGFNYIRMLSMVSWPGQEIAPVLYHDKGGLEIPAWPDYDTQFATLMDAARKHGLRMEITMFADAQRIMPDKTERQAHVDRILRLIGGRERDVLLIEVANEAWQNGFPGDSGIDELRELGESIAVRTPVLAALSSPPDSADRRDILHRMYGHSAADVATIHFSRDTRTMENGWLPVRDCWEFARLPGLPPVSSNEPIGPGSSVASEDDPARICAAAAFAYLSGLPMYVFHCEAGTYARSSFTDYPWLRDFKALLAGLPPDLPMWERNDGLEPAAPFTVFLDDKPNAYWENPAKHERGVLRNCGTSKGSDFVCLSLGVLQGGVELEARRDCALVVRALPNLAILLEKTVSKGQRFAVNGHAQACLITGRYRSL